MDEDIQLIECYLSGDDSAMAKLIDKYQKEVYFFVYRFLGDKEDAKDVTQTIFIKLFRKIKQFKRKSSFKTWLFSIAVNSCKNFKKHKYISISSEDMSRIPDSKDIQTEVIKKEQKEMIKRGLLSLPKKQRITLILRIFHELPYKDISKIMRCSESTAKSNFFFGIERLKEIIGEKYEL
ncbi:MAG: hypothetical protein DRG20_02525 [Deltaproteobacteria bacterium]|nr:MAG: hypothetical protein DRG20_02525 [Deltaproteobacteria bacterium]